MNTPSPLYPQPPSSPFQYLSFLLTSLSHPLPMLPFPIPHPSFPNTNISNNFFLQNSHFIINNHNPTLNILSNTSSQPNANSSNKASTPLVSEDQSNGKNTSPHKTLLGNKKKRATKMCTACPHKYAIHYAKNMCSNCYHVKGRSKKPWNCTHVNKAHYALGLCQNCYQMKYIRKQVDNEKGGNKGDDV